MTMSANAIDPMPRPVRARRSRPGAGEAQRQQQMWASGDFHAVATLIQPVADALFSAVDLQAGWRVLDVAAGSGNAAIAAARYGCDVVGIDYVPALLERGRRRVEAEGLRSTCVEGDAEAIPLPDASFDAVLSVFGSMFAPNHERRPPPSSRASAAPAGASASRRGRPTGSSARCSRSSPGTSRRRPASPRRSSGAPKAYVSDLLGDRISALACTERTFTFRFRSAEAFVDYFRTYYGPTVKAFEAVGDAGRDALFADLVYLVRRHAGTGTGPVAIPATWLETVAIRGSYSS